MRFHVVLGLCCWLPGPALLLLGWLGALAPLEQALHEVAREVSLAPKVASGAALAGLFLAPIVLQASLLSAARRRYGRCKVGPEGLVFAIAPADFDDEQGVVELPWSALSGFEASPGAIRVHPREREANRFGPLVIPIQSEEDERAAIAWLTGHSGVA